MPSTSAETMGVKVRESSPHTSTSSTAVGMKVNTTALNTIDTLLVPAEHSREPLTPWAALSLWSQHCCRGLCLRKLSYAFIAACQGDEST